MIDLTINNVIIPVQVDCGATCNVISYRKIKQLFPNPREITFTGVPLSLKTYNGNIIKSIGNVTLECTRNNKSFKITFAVVRENLETILGCKSS